MFVNGHPPVAIAPQKTAARTAQRTVRERRNGTRVRRIRLVAPPKYKVLLHVQQGRVGLDERSGLPGLSELFVLFVLFGTQGSWVMPVIMPVTPLWLLKWQCDIGSTSFLNPTRLDFAKWHNWRNPATLLIIILIKRKEEERKRSRKKMYMVQ